MAPPIVIMTERTDDAKEKTKGDSDEHSKKQDDEVLSMEPDSVSETENPSKTEISKEDIGGDCGSTISSGGLGCTVTFRGNDVETTAHENGKSKTDTNKNNNGSTKASSGNKRTPPLDKSIHSSSEATTNTNSSPSNESSSDKNKKSPTPPKKKKKLNYTPSKLGRKGDPRMHSALKARLQDPNLSLHDALIAGGFEFHSKDGVSFDNDNVQVGQRKNQLSRRLRLYKQNQKENKTGLQISDINPSNFKKNTEQNDSNLSQTSPKRMRSDGGTAQMSDHSLSQNGTSSSNIINLLPQSRSLLQQGNHVETASDKILNLMNTSHFNSSMLNSSDGSSTSKNDFYQYQNQLLNNTNSTTTTSTSDNAQKLNQALNLYRFDSSALMKRCLLSAGFSHQETEECDEIYLLFGELALDNERKRLERIRSRMNIQPIMMNTAGVTTATTTTATVGDPTFWGSTAQPTTHAGYNKEGLSSFSNSRDGLNTFSQKETIRRNDLNSKQSSNNQESSSKEFALGMGGTVNTSKYTFQLPQQSDSHNNSHGHSHDNNLAHSHDHSHNHSHSTDRNESASFYKHMPCNNQHVHRLEGKCGHKAVIHKPTSGKPHVDFLVDGKIECYEHCQPQMDSAAFWLSKYKCEKIHNQEKTLSVSIFPVFSSCLSI